MKETTEADFLDFTEACQVWINKLHLNDWDCKFAVRDKEGADAWCNISHGTRKVLLCIVPQREGLSSIEELAKHECLEILLADLAGTLSVYRSEGFVEDEVHKVINRLMKVLQ